MNCGDEFWLRNADGSNLTRFAWFCRGRWMALQNQLAFGYPVPLDHPLYMHNGTIGNWQWALAYLIRAAKMPAQEGYRFTVNASYAVNPVIVLEPTMRVSELASLFDVSCVEMRDELKDYVITVDES